MINIDNIWVLEIAGFEIWITETIVNTWFIMLVLILFAIIARIKLRTFKEVPRGFQNVIEIIVETFDKFVTNTLGEELSYIAPWFLWCLYLFYHQAYLVFLALGLLLLTGQPPLPWPWLAFYSCSSWV